MKKMVNLTAIILTVILFLTLFTACSGASIDSYLPLKERKNPKLNNSSEIALGENEEVCSLNNASNMAALQEEKMLIIKNTDSGTYYLYDLSKETYVGDKNYTEIEYFCRGIFLAAKGTDDDKRYGLLSADGEELHTNERDGNSFVYSKEDFSKSADGYIIRVFYLYYKIIDRAIEPIGNTANFSFGIDPKDIQKLHLYGDFLYAYTGDIKNGVSDLTAYTLGGTMLKNFEDEGENTKYFILNGGNVLIMKDLIVPFDTKDYTYMNDAGNKRLVKYEIFNLDSKKVRSANFNYYIEKAECHDNLTAQDKEYFSLDVLDSNKIFAYEIKDKKLIKTDSYKKGLFVNNYLNVIADIGLYDIHKLSDDRFLWVSLIDKQNSFISDKSGSAICIIGVNYEIRSYNADEPAYAGDFIIVYNKVIKKYSAIDKEGEMITEYLYDRMSLFYGGKAFGETGGKMHIINADGRVEEKDNVERYLNDGIFYITKTGDICSPNGTVLFANGIGANPIKLYDGTYFFEVILADNSKVYQYVK